MPKWLALALVPILALSIFSSLAIASGRGQPLRPGVALLHLDRCAPPCWIGITPGKTPWIEAERLIRQVFNPDSGFQLNIYSSAWDGIDSSGETQSVVIRSEREAFYLEVALIYIIAPRGDQPVEAISFEFSHDPTFATNPFTLAELWYLVTPPSTTTALVCCSANDNVVSLLDASQRIEFVTHVDSKFLFEDTVTMLNFYADEVYKDYATRTREWHGFTFLGKYHFGE